MLKHEGYVTYGDNNKGRILDGVDIGDHDTIIIKMCYMWKDLNITC